MSIDIIGINPLIFRRLYIPYAYIHTCIRTGIGVSIGIGIGIRMRKRIGIGIR